MYAKIQIARYIIQGVFPLLFPHSERDMVLLIHKKRLAFKGVNPLFRPQFPAPPANYS